MRKFKHGDHDCSVLSMDLGEALNAGLLKSYDGSKRAFALFATGRAAYAFCTVCGHYAWSASETMEDTDESLEGMAIRGFQSAANESCEVQMNTELVRDVMTS